MNPDFDLVRLVRHSLVVVVKPVPFHRSGGTSTKSSSPRIASCQYSSGELAPGVDHAHADDDNRVIDVRVWRRRREGNVCWLDHRADPTVGSDARRWASLIAGLDSARPSD